MDNKIKTKNPVIVSTGLGQQKEIKLLIELTRVEIRSNFNNLYLYYSVQHDETKDFIHRGEFNLMLSQIDEELESCEINLQESNYRDSMRCVAMSIFIKKVAEMLNVPILELEVTE